MKLSTIKKDGGSNNFNKAEVGKYLALTNFFGHLEKGDFAEWNLADINKPRLKVLSTHKPSNYSFARAFPMLIVGSAFGKIWDCFGYASGKVKASADGRKRGTSYEEAPWCDLNVVTKLTGFPCAVVDMPETVVITKTRFEGEYNGNQLIDTYCHWRGKGDVNEDIWPPFSKLLNLQFQCNFAKKRLPKSHAFGYSGGTPIFEVEIDGIRWCAAHKLETLAGNKFDFISWCQWDGATWLPTERINISAVWTWVLANWDTVIVPSAEKAGIKFQPNLTRENLLASYCDGVHVGSEILGECDGEVIWEEFAINVAEKAPNSPAIALKAKTGTNTKGTEKAPQKAAQGASEHKPKRLKKKKAGGTESSSSGYEWTVKAGETKDLKNKDNWLEATNNTTHAVQIRGIWKTISVFGNKAGQTDIVTFKDKNGNKKDVVIKVV